jgi:hypothetical protein
MVQNDFSPPVENNSEKLEEEEDQFGYAFVRDQGSKIYFHAKKKVPGNGSKI